MYQFVLRFARKLGMVPGKEGIMQISNKQAVIDISNDILTKFKQHGVPNEAIKSENDVKVIYNQILNLEDQQLRRNVISPGDPRHKEVTDRIFGKKKTTADLIDLGLVRKGKNVKKTTPKEAVDPKLVEEVKVKETFDDANKRFTKTDVVADTVTRIISMEPVAAMKEANKIIGRKGIYKNLTKEQSQKILKDTDDWIFQRDPDDLYDYNKKRPFRDDPDYEPEDFAHGGRTGSGLNYLLGEDDQNSRVPFKDGTKFDPKRRGFLKVAAGLASIPFIGKYFKWAKPLAKTAKVADLTSVPINNVAGMPAWFKPLVNRVIKEGDDVTAKLATGERQIVHTKKLDEFDEVTVTQDLNTGNVRVEYHGSGNMGEAPIQLDYKASEWIEPQITKKGQIAEPGMKTSDEFSAVESEPRVANWDGDIEWDGENVVSKVDDLLTDTTKLEAYATGKKPNIKKLLKSEKKQKKVNKLNEDQVEQAEYIEQKYGPGPDPTDFFDEKDLGKDFASGGRVPSSGGLAGMLGE